MLIPINIIPRQTKIVKHFLISISPLQVIRITIPVIKVYKLKPLLLWNNKLPKDGIITIKDHQPGNKILYFGSAIASTNAIIA